MKLLLTCEHGGNQVPRRYATLFRGAERVLAGHRGWDPGALWLARRLSRRLSAPLLAATVTRLLIDPNRSLTNPQAFSEFSRHLPADEKARIVARHYRPHRERVESRIGREIRRGARVLHVAVHSFTPRWRGRVRSCQVGLLYDPHRTGERCFCQEWKACLEALAPSGLRVRRNQPYRGDADGLTTHLRRRFGSRRYLGIELEVSQALLGKPARAKPVAGHVEQSLRELVSD